MKKIIFCVWFIFTILISQSVLGEFRIELLNGSSIIAEKYEIDYKTEKVKYLKDGSWGEISGSEVVDVLLLEVVNNSVPDMSSAPSSSLKTPGDSGNISGSVQTINDAAESGSLDMVKQFLKKGADINARRPKGSSVLMCAIASKNDTLINWLLDNGTNIHICNDFGQTALTTAVSYNSINTVNRLLSMGADVNFQYENKATALYFAAQDGRTSIAEILVKNGANTEQRCIDSNWRALHIACAGGHIDVVKVLLANGADINAKNDFLMTPLHYAVWNNHSDIADYLLKNGASVNEEMIEGYTPLELAVQKGNSRIQGILMKYGATYH